MGRHIGPLDRKTIIMAAALTMAKQDGYKSVRRDALALKSDCAAGLINKLFGNMEMLRDEIVRVAVSEKILTVLAQAIVDQHPDALAAPLALRKKAMRQ